jgi:hypothetical protein
VKLYIFRGKCIAIYKIFPALWEEGGGEYKNKNLQ